MTAKTDFDRCAWYLEDLERVVELICTVPPHILWTQKERMSEAHLALCDAMIRAGKSAGLRQIT